MCSAITLNSCCYDMKSVDITLTNQVVYLPKTLLSVTSHDQLVQNNSSKRSQWKV